MHELDELAKPVAAKAFCPMKDGYDLALEQIDFVDGVSFNGGDARMTIWTVDEQFIFVLSVVAGEGEPVHATWQPGVL